MTLLRLYHIKKNKRTTPVSPIISYLIIWAFILYFWTIGLTHLDRFPKIHEDEAWQAAPGYTFWAEGRFGADLFAGFYGMEQHYYGFMPLFPILVGAALHLFGLGLFQARLVPLMLMTLTLALTYRLGIKLFSPWHGLITVAILVTWRIASPFAHLTFGIPLADVARIVRYDSAVPVFGLLAVLVVVERWGDGEAGRLGGWEINNKGNLSLSLPHFVTLSLCHRLAFPYLIAGLLIGLATLSHLYGAFWLPALLLALLWSRGRRAIGPGIALGLGFGLALLPWLFFVLSGWEDFLNQSRNYSDRFGLFDVRFYAANLLLEAERYRPLLSGTKHALGSWLWLIGGGLSMAWLARTAFSRGGGTRHYVSLLTPHSSLLTPHTSRLLLACLLTIPLLFGLLISFKTFSYLAMLWPLLALALAAGLVHLWQMRPRRPWWRPLLAGLFLLAILEGLISVGRAQWWAGQLTPYQTFTRQIAAQLPAHSRVLGLQHYWLGLAGSSQNYRSILVPIFWTNPKYVTEPVSFAQAAETFPSDIVLLDQIMLDFLAGPDAGPAELRDQIWTYLQQRQAVLVTELDDPTYGRLQIYRLLRFEEGW